ncbi:MAG: hypothetical protein ABEK50_16945, partial [bacterium]
MRDRPLRQLFLVLLASLLTGGTLSGCSSDQDKTTETESKTLSVNQAAGNIIQPLNNLKTQYSQAVKNGTTADKAAYERVNKNLDKAKTAWKSTRPFLKKKLPDQKFKTVNRGMAELVSSVDSKVPEKRLSSLVNEITGVLSGLQTKGIPEARRGTVRSIKQADRDIQGETTVRDYRIGATLKPSRPIYSGSTTASSVTNTNYQLRVVLRS